MQTRATLPEWLDDFIFGKLKAQYHRSNCDMTVIDWGKEEILNYLGTYFPRSYTESYCIFKCFLQESSSFSEFNTLSILDFGCGTGGEVIGFATALSECRPNIQSIVVKAIDGNQFALNRFEDICDEFNKNNILKINSRASAVKIDDFYDLTILDAILDGQYDIIISFKAVCEFVTKQQFEEKNAYEHLLKFMLPKLADGGVMLLVDVTTCNNVVQEWLPNMMDRGLQVASIRVIGRNKFNNECFKVSHSMYTDDVSKIAWRLITNNS
jgi:ribosomal protein RSM22 (predicted rRNA methylase)